MKPRELVEQWVKKKKSFYFFLPDGPYGRPFDNQYFIDKIEDTSDGFDVIFTDSLVLHFTGMPDVVDEGCNLLISKFTQCVLEIKGNKSNSYDYGEVALSGF
ncbi:hypothetical protein [Biostraticola tofi]|uniref:Uncharacterized protein n=1 Tax=Biostraticola tofi TaxID=466109 RepID=A0A4V2W384_9GAMM|nr:hypothetical protein [Biostraticola tofi]TCV90989.1 hypothetical protein EDC52_1262 [Biostraticola tofi]